MKTFINSQNKASENNQVITNLYMYWHEQAADNITSLQSDELQEIQELVAILPKDLVLKQITSQNIDKCYTTYTYLFETPGALLGTKAQAATESKVEQFLSYIRKLTGYEGSYQVTPINGTNLIIGTFLIG